MSDRQIFISKVNLKTERIKIILITTFCFILCLVISNKEIRPTINGNVNHFDLVENFVFATILAGIISFIMGNLKLIRQIEFLDDKKVIRILFQKAFMKEKSVALNYNQLQYKTKIDKEKCLSLTITDNKDWNFTITEFDSNATAEIEEKLREVGVRKLK